MSPIFALFQINILKTINCLVFFFFYVKEFVFQETHSKRNKDPKHRSRAGQHTPAEVVREPWRHGALLLGSDQRRQPGLGAVLVLLSWSAPPAAGTRAEPSCWRHRQGLHLAHTRSTATGPQSLLGLQPGL